METLLLAAGFRLPDGRCDEALYPSAAAYANANRVTDCARFNNVCMDGNRIYRRIVLRERLFSSVDNREHQLVALLYMVLVVVWFASVMRRAMQRGVRRTALFTALILLLWMCMRLMKWQIPDNTLSRYLWYGYYICQMALPWAALRLAWNIDRREDAPFPGWLRAIIAISTLLLILVLSNDLHNLVFQIDLRKGTHCMGKRLYDGCRPVPVAVFRDRDVQRHELAPERPRPRLPAVGPRHTGADGGAGCELFPTPVAPHPLA
ncbi:MAG: hypothetical protein FWF10_02355 [Clostridiales bacterium]|nr:hypothetical protein [Clostridiales bacterium]